MNPNIQSAMPRVENISCILPETAQLGGLYLGNIFGAQNADILKQYGIRAVITTSAETKIIHRMEDIPFHLSFEAHDKEDYQISEHINDCIHFIEQNRKFTNVYVHCYAGVSRSSAVICAYIMWKYRWPLAKTLAFVSFKRIVVKPNSGFIKQLKEIEALLKITSPQNQNTVSKSTTRAHKIMNPHSSRSFQEQLYQPRPSSSRDIPLLQNPQCPPLNKNFSQKMAANPPMHHQYGSQSEYMNNSGYRKVNASSGERRPSMTQDMPQKLNHRPPQPHNEAHIPRILSKKSQYSKKPSSDYEDERNRQHLYNDYMQSPPTSPRFLPKKPDRKSIDSHFSSLHRSPQQSDSQHRNPHQPHNYKSIYTETDVYSSNYSRKGYQSNEKSMNSSRCLIRPRDLPGYKIY